MTFRWNYFQLQSNVINQLHHGEVVDDVRWYFYLYTQCFDVPSLLQRLSLCNSQYLLRILKFINGCSALELWSEWPSSNFYPFLWPLVKISNYHLMERAILMCSSVMQRWIFLFLASARTVFAEPHVSHHLIMQHTFTIAQILIALPAGAWSQCRNPHAEALEATWVLQTASIERHRKKG